MYLVNSKLSCKTSAVSLNSAKLSFLLVRVWDIFEIFCQLWFYKLSCRVTGRKKYETPAVRAKSKLTRKRLVTDNQKSLSTGSNIVKGNKEIAKKFENFNDLVDWKQCINCSSRFTGLTLQKDFFFAKTIGDSVKRFEVNAFKGDIYGLPHFETYWLCHE